MAYTAARGSRVLLETAALVSDVERRIAETGRLLFAVMSPEPGVRPLRPGSNGYTTALTVRGFHATMRRMLEDREPWKSEWTVPMTHDDSIGADPIPPGARPPEVPINQEDLLGTLTTFTVVVIESLTKMGVKYTDKERDAYLHTWLVVGHLLGVNYDLLREHPFNKDLEPLTYFEMQLVKEAVFRRHADFVSSPTHGPIGNPPAAENTGAPYCSRPTPPATYGEDRPIRGVNHNRLALVLTALLPLAV